MVNKTTDKNKHEHSDGVNNHSGEGDNRYGLQTPEEAKKNDYRPYEWYYMIHFRAFGLRQLKDGRWTYTKSNIIGINDKRYTFIITDYEKDEIESKHLGTQFLLGFTTVLIIRVISTTFFHKSESILHTYNPYSTANIIQLSVCTLAFIASIIWGSKKISKLNQKIFNKYGIKNDTRKHK